MRWHFQSWDTIFFPNKVTTYEKSMFLKNNVNDTNANQDPKRTKIKMSIYVFFLETKRLITKKNELPEKERAIVLSKQAEKNRRKIVANCNDLFLVHNLWIFRIRCRFGSWRHQVNTERERERKKSVWIPVENVRHHESIFGFPISFIIIVSCK